MQGDIKSPLGRFATELDELIDRWKEKPADDQVSVGEMLGVLNFAAFQLMADAREMGKEHD